MPSGRFLAAQGCVPFRRYPHQSISDEPGHIIYIGLYMGGTGATSPSAIVASVSLIESDEGEAYMIDWSAYMGGDPDLYASPGSTALVVARHGNKLPEHIARAVFPEITEIPYRL